VSSFCKYADKRSESVSEQGRVSPAQRHHKMCHSQNSFHPALRAVFKVFDFNFAGNTLPCSLTFYRNVLFSNARLESDYLGMIDLKPSFSI
jgi:hypothetical protein